MPSAWVPGEPVGKGRPRLGKHGRVYTPDRTRNAERAVGLAWWAPMIGEGIPVAVKVTAFYRRPLDHLRSNGELTAKGQRLPVPMRTPDLDNVVKLVLDGLNGIAFADDKQVQSIEALRYWERGDGPGVLVQVRELRPTELGGSVL